jgi:hypothetical protein
LLPQREILQRQLAARANRGVECPKKDPKPPDHDRPNSRSLRTTQDRCGRRVFRRDRWRHVPENDPPGTKAHGLQRLVVVGLGSKQHDRDGNGLLGSGCSGRPGHRARAFGPREREPRGIFPDRLEGLLAASCMPPRPENRPRLRGAPPDPSARERERPMITSRIGRLLCRLVKDTSRE